MRLRVPKVGEEPYVTIRTDTWDDGLARLPSVAGDQQAHLQSLISHIEVGWRRVAHLQLLFELNRQLAREDTFDAQVLNYIDSDVTDLFRGLAWDALWLIPGASGPPPRTARRFYPDRDELSADTDYFVRCLSMLHVASFSRAVSADLRREIRAHTEPLIGWGARFYHIAEPLVP